MSHLDQHFAVRATRGLLVQEQIAPGESTIEPGSLYLVEGADVNSIFGIAAHSIAEVAGKRIALKVVADAPTPPGGNLEITAPDGQLIEDDNGVLNDGVAIVGKTELGSYREWLCDSEGNWWLVGRVAGGVGLPLGQITIKGVPITIQGVPLVNTVPAPLAPPPPVPVIVAPAIILPRPTRLLGPGTLAPTIELEDAFADTSLAMDTAGEKFRVAQGSIRFPFVLRKLNTAETSYEELGVFRFDASPFGGALVLEAELEVAAAGQTAQLELWNVTAGVTVATLSSTSRVTQRVATAPLALPSSEALYSLRLRRVGGTSAQRVMCRSAAFELGA